MFKVAARIVLWASLVAAAYLASPPAMGQSGIRVEQIGAWEYLTDLNKDAGDIVIKAFIQTEDIFVLFSCTQENPFYYFIFFMKRDDIVPDRGHVGFHGSSYTEIGAASLDARQFLRAISEAHSIDIVAMTDAGSVMVTLDTAGSGEMARRFAVDCRLP